MMIAELDTPGHSAAYNKYVYYHQEEVIHALVEHGYLDRDTYLNADGSVKKNFYTHKPGPSGTGNFELLSIDEESSNAEEAENARNAKIFMTALFDEWRHRRNRTDIYDGYRQRGSRRVLVENTRYQSRVRKIYQLYARFAGRFRKEGGAQQK